MSAPEADAQAATMPAGWSFDPELRSRSGGAWWLVARDLRLTVYLSLDGRGWTGMVEERSPLTGNAVSRRTTTERWATAADAAEHLEIEELGRRA